MRDRRAAGRGSVLFLCSKQSAPTPDPFPRAFRAGEGNPASLRLSSIVPALPCESALQAKTAASSTLLRVPLPLAVACRRGWRRVSRAACRPFAGVPARINRKIQAVSVAVARPRIGTVADRINRRIQAVPVALPRRRYGNHAPAGIAGVRVPVFSCFRGAWGLVIRLIAATGAYAVPGCQRYGGRRVVVGRPMVVDLPIAAVRLAPVVFVEAHLLDVFADAHQPVDGGEHAGQLADRNLLAAEGVEDEPPARVGVAGRFDLRQLPRPGERRGG